MTYQAKIAPFVFAVVLWVAVIGVIPYVAWRMQGEKEIEQNEEVIQEPALAVLTHPQEVWVSVLEWCESRGVKTAINPMDRDGTPSYYSFQFKPATFEYYREKYGLPEADISDYNTQKEIVRRMIGDPDVQWNQEFPDCVRKHGLPPKPAE